MMMRHADAPADAGVPQTPETANRIMHARLKVGDRLLMGGDAPPQFVSKPQGFCVSIMVDDPAEAERIFRELAEGSVVRMPIAETFWARRFGVESIASKFAVNLTSKILKRCFTGNFEEFGEAVQRMKPPKTNPNQSYPSKNINSIGVEPINRGANR